MNTRFKKFRRVLLAWPILLFLQAVPALADDIEIFSAGLGHAQNPNVLFVLDMSGSMNFDVNGDSPGSSGLPSRADVLRDSVEQLLDANASRINAGFSTFRTISSGILWPVSPLDAYANTIDPGIPVTDTLRSKDVFMSILNDNWVGSNTATVGGLAEAARYFRGEEVAVGGKDAKYTWYFSPRTWDNSLGEYTGSEHSAHQYSYSPYDAFKKGVPNGFSVSCSDYSVGGTESGTNYCASRTVTSCDAPIAASSGSNGDGPWSSAARQICYYDNPDSWTGADYNSPIVDACQKNFIVLISDGEPTKSNSADVEPMLGHPTAECEDLSSTIFGSISTTSDQGNCGPEIVKYLHDNDQKSAIPGSNVTTYTIGFSVEGPGQDYLKRLATDGGGEFFAANKASELTAALDDVISNILAGNENFAELSIDVNKATFSNDNRAFFSLFNPSSSQSWKGNLKGYFLDSEGIKDTNNTIATVTDATGTQFSDTAQSFWSDDPDGKDVLAGGTSAKLSTATRNIYTYTGDSKKSIDKALYQSDHSNHVAVENDKLESDMLGIVPKDSDAREELIDWIHQAPMGDPLHSKSTTVKYPFQTVVYAMTNQGVLHAFDATYPTDPTAADHSGGDEIFAFIPPELLANQRVIKTATGYGDHIYGLDGGMTRWHEDVNNNGIVDNAEEVLLIFGMRRGGASYYALDVTDPDDPIYKWTIKGGQSGFEKLAQTWSRMSLINVVKDGMEQRVLVFGGGYDASALDGTTSRVPSSGNSIYMIDMEGKLIWSAGDLNMIYGIPSDISVIDSDNDNVADRMYAADLGGQVWRVDFDDVKSGFEINRVADLGASSFQPFFYAPSISLDYGSGGEHLVIALGSGNRTNPLDPASNNKFYVLKDKHSKVGPPSVSVSTITPAKLYNATSNDAASANPTKAAAAKNEIDSAQGWYIDLAPGEKSLSQVVMFQRNLLATTFSPNSTTSSGDACVVSTSTGRFYAMNSRNASPIPLLSTNTTDGTSPGDRNKIISTNGIPSSPVVAFPPGADSVKIFVDMKIEESFKPELQTVYWFPRH